MDWLLNYSKPRLTASRKGQVSVYTTSQTKSNLQYNELKIGYSVAKAVTTWLNDIKYNETQEYIKISPKGEDIVIEHPHLNDPYSYIIQHEMLHDVSRRIELATKFNVTSRYGASEYQTTNYGLAGMVVTHIDPYGYEEGVKLTEEKAYLTKTGDYIATIMGWFEDTPGGGNTAFITKGYEGTVQPTKGSAAF